MGFTDQKTRQWVPDVELLASGCDARNPSPRATDLVAVLGNDLLALGD